MKNRIAGMIGVIALAAGLVTAQTSQVPLQSLKAGKPTPAAPAITGVVIFTSSGFYVGTLQQLASAISPLLPAPAAPTLNKTTTQLTSWDGNTPSFAIPVAFITGTLEVHLNGLLMAQVQAGGGVGDFAMSTSGAVTTVTFVAASMPQPGDIVLVSYFQ
jgi:hypothetical protein